ncbi:MAG: QueT transporter family protein, partial [Candidatus Bathyarchaeota archaeon]
MVESPTDPLYKSRSGDDNVKIKSKDLSLVAVFASLYAVLTYLFAPISFYALQFRIAGIIRPAIAKKWILSVGYAIGVVVGNVFSPFAGIYELMFMPLMSLIAGIVGHMVARKMGHNYFVAGAVIATIIPVSVSWMLNQLFTLPIPVTLPYLLL